MAEVKDEPRPNALRRLYAWTLALSSGPHAWTALAAISFAEASFFPIPPDIMLLPMMLADRKRAFWIAGWCTLWSVLGGLLGYAIGAFLYGTLGHWLISVYGLSGDMNQFRTLYREYGALIILIKGATPIPFKLVTIASGFAGYNLAAFIGLSVITRGVRFGLIAVLLFVFGAQVRVFVEKYLEWVMIGVAAVIVLGFVAIRYL
ncbi:MAG: DedA family protein [Proteobacteria bacterium]|nr:DedA family protein [Pseudomonadota bacterium]